MKKILVVVLAMLPTIAFSTPRNWIYLGESHGIVWLLDVNGSQSAQGWGGDYSHPGAVLISTVHVKISSFPKLNSKLRQQYADAVQVKMDNGWVPFQSAFGGPNQFDDPKRIAFIELLADTNYLDMGPENHEWVAVDCSTGDVGLREVSQTKTVPTYHAATGMYSGASTVTAANKWLPAANVPTNYHPLVDFVCNPKLRQYEGVQ